MAHFFRDYAPWAKGPVDWLVGKAALGLLGSVKMLGPERASALGGFLARNLGGLTPTNRIGLANLKAAFPEKSETEIKAILKGVWDNLGRTAAEYAVMDDLWDFDPDKPGNSRITTDAIPIFERLRDDGKGAIIFAAHLANWELPAVAAAAHGLEATALYRMPNNRHVAEAIVKIRAKTMGRMADSRAGGVLQLARDLDHGSHVGMLADQHLARGVPVMFFGRPCLANPTIAKLANQFDVPVHGVRVIRQEGCRFRLEVTDEVTLPRDEHGRVAIEPAMQKITAIIEDWVRAEPSQWLWLHRRWR